MNPDDLRRADAIEIVVGQGAKPGGGGMLLGHKISNRVAGMRDLPTGIDQRSASRHPDWTGPDDLEIKILELREITDWRKPIFVKVGATRTYYDVRLAVEGAADVIVVDGSGAGRRRRRGLHRARRHPDPAGGAPSRRRAAGARDAPARAALVSGRIRSGADVAKALALGADAVSIGTAALIALGDNSPDLDEGTGSSAAPRVPTTTGGRGSTRRGSPPGPRLAARFDPVVGGRRLAGYLRVRRSRRRPSPAPAGSRTSTTSSPRTCGADGRAAAMARAAGRHGLDSGATGSWPLRTETPIERAPGVLEQGRGRGACTRERREARPGALEGGIAAGMPSGPGTGAAIAFRLPARAPRRRRPSHGA
jgi:hypothetical protein